MSRSAPSTSSPSRWISSLNSERSPDRFQSAAKSTDRSSAKSVETTRPVATSTSLTCIFDMPEPMSKAARRRRPERSAIVPALSIQWLDRGPAGGVPCCLQVSYARTRDFSPI